MCCERNQKPYRAAKNGFIRQEATERLYVSATYGSTLLRLLYPILPDIACKRPANPHHRFQKPKILAYTTLTENGSTKKRDAVQLLGLRRALTEFSVYLIKLLM